MIIDKKLQQAVGILRTHDTEANNLAFLEALRDPKNVERVIETYKAHSYPFYRFYANYNTGIGETIEEIVGKKFTDIIPKQIRRIGKNGKVCKPGPNPVYTEYYKDHGFSGSNFDWLLKTENGIRKVEVKVIRAAESKDREGSKIYETPSLLEERALTYAKGQDTHNGTFQQTKPELFDYILGIVMYADRVDYYLVPTSDINHEENIVWNESTKGRKYISGKLILRPQHAKAQKNPNGTYTEGHLVLSELQDEKDGYHILSAHTEEELLATDELCKYIK